MEFVVLYLVTAVLFLGLDVVALKMILRPLFEKHVPDLLADDVRLAPAAGFYLLYVGGILWFASLEGLRSGDLGSAALSAALFGFFAYGTYEATNLATLRGWSWEMVAVDVAWGTVLTAGSAILGILIARSLLG